MTGRPGGERKKDFFISRAGADAGWSQWIAWQLEAAGYSVIVQDWDFPAGSNFVSNMRRALDEAVTTIPVYSAAYFSSRYTEDEWTAAFVHSQEEGTRLLPIRVEAVDVPRLLGPIEYVDLVGVDEDTARERILRAVRNQGRAKPSREPRFPGTESPRFPSVTGEVEGPHPVRVVNLPPVDVSRFADRNREQEELGRYLLDDLVRLVTVVGRAGIGKSALATRVLGTLKDSAEGDGAGRPRGIVLLTARGTGLSLERIYTDAKQLLDEITAGRLGDLWSRLDLTLGQKVDALVQSMRGRRVLILLDALDQSLGDDGAIVEDGLRMFVEVCLRQADGPRLVVTSREDVPIAPDAFPAVRMIRLRGGLDPEDAVFLLRGLDPQGDLGLRDALDENLRRAADLAHGIPRALEILAGILRSDPAASLHQLLADERALGSLVVESLVAEGYRRLSLPDQRVMQIMGAFDRPVREAAITFVVHSWFPEIDVGSSLRRLTASYFATATRATGEYSLQSVDLTHAYAQIPEAPEPGGEEADGRFPYCRAAIESRVADFYSTIRKPPDQWLSIEDVAPQIAEFEHRVRAGEIDRALEVLEQIDQNHLFLWGHYSRLIELRRSVLGKPATARLSASNLASLGIVSQVLGEYDVAAGHYEEAVRIAREGDRDAVAHYVGDLGRLYRNLGLMDSAIRFSQEALDAALERGDRRAEGIWRDRLGLAVGTLGRLAEARSLHEEAISIAREVGDRRSEGAALSNLGLILQLEGRVRKAENVYEESLAIARDIGDRRGVPIILGRLGTVAESLDDFERAIGLHEEAQTVAEALGDRREESYQLLGLGRARLGMGRLEEAERDLLAARDLDMPETSYLASLGASLALIGRGDEGARASFQDAVRRSDERLARCSDLFAGSLCLGDGTGRPGRNPGGLARRGGACGSARAGGGGVPASNEGLCGAGCHRRCRARSPLPRRGRGRGARGPHRSPGEIRRSGGRPSPAAGWGMTIRGVLFDFGETLVERVSDQSAPLSRLLLTPFSDSVATLQEMKQAGYLLGIVSNTEQSDEREMERALETIGLLEYFDAVVTSITAGSRKPAPGIFLRALERLRCSPEEAVMVGDDPATDIAGAAALGLVTMLVRRRPRDAVLGIEPTFAVSSLLEVPAILDGLRACPG